MDLEKFSDFLSAFCKRPAMFMGKKDIVSVWIYLDGYSKGVSNCLNHWSMIGGWNVWDNFHTWLRCKYWDTSDTANYWSMEKVLFHNHEHSHAKAISAIPELFQEYLKEDSNSLDATHDKLLNGSRNMLPCSACLAVEDYDG